MGISRDIILKNLSKADARRGLDQIENELAAKPTKYPSLEGRFTLLRSYYVGEYRGIFALIETEVAILRVVRRKEVDKG